MSFLANKLKLEVKSTNQSQLARFTSTTDTANLHVIPEDSSNFYAVIGASLHSNIEGYIALNSQNINQKIVSFYDTNINFGTDTLLKGNLVVLGSVITLGYDILTEENTFLLNNYGSSAAKGINSASTDTLINLRQQVSSTSNALSSKINISAKYCL
jgi:hypothetical protein